MLDALLEKPSNLTLRDGRVSKICLGIMTYVVVTVTKSEIALKYH
jgi:hypothetical protein